MDDKFCELCQKKVGYSHVHCRICQTLLSLSHAPMGVCIDCVAKTHYDKVEIPGPKYARNRT